MPLTNIRPNLENRQFRGIKQGKIFYFSKYTMIVTLTLFTPVLERQIKWVSLVERNQEI